MKIASRQQNKEVIPQVPRPQQGVPEAPVRGSEVQLTQKACNSLNQFVFYLSFPIVAEGLKMISAPFILNMSQFRGWWRP